MWFNVEVSSHFNGSIAIVHNSTLKTPHHLRRPHLSLTQCRTSLSFRATWWDAMSHVMCTQYKQHKQAMKVKWSECKVQLKQKNNNCSCPFRARRCTKELFWYHFHCDSSDNLDNHHSYCSYGNCYLYLQKVYAMHLDHYSNIIHSTV